MTLLDVMGHFWLAANPDRQVAGRLIIDAMYKAQLELIGPLSIGDDDYQRYRILGDAAGNLLTLEQCTRIKRTTQHSPYGLSVRENYSPAFVLEGAHFEESEPLEFDSVTIRLQNLEQWVGITGMKTNFLTDETGIEEINMKYTPIQNHSADIDYGSVDLSFRFNFSIEPISIPKLDESCSLTINFSSKSHIMGILGACSDLQDLLTLCVGRPTTIIDASLKRSEVLQVMRLYYNWLGSYGQDNQAGILPRQMLMTFHDIGGVEGISAWLDGAEKLRPVVAPLRSYWYTPNLGGPTRFINLFSALEVFDREISEDRDPTDRNDPILNRITRPIKKINHLISPLVGDTDNWALEIRDMRNAFVHSDVPESIDYARIYFLEESLYFSLVMLLLAECGAPEETLLKVQKNSRLQFAVEKLKG